MSDVSFGVLLDDENEEERPDRSLRSIARRSTFSDLLPENPVSNAELLDAERATPEDPGFIQSFQNAWEARSLRSSYTRCVYCP